MLLITIFMERYSSVMKVQTAFRLEKELLDRIREKAKAQKRSLNNYVEYLLYKDVGDIPNETTEKAIEEARRGEDLESLDDLNDLLDRL
jgi:hypothetical protein